MLALSRDVFYLAVASSTAIVGARQDLKSRRIPNALTGCSLLVGLVLHLVLGGPRALGMSALAGVIGGAILLVMYVAGGMGAGDVKLMAAVGCVAGLASLRTILIGTFLSGAIFGIALALYHQRVRQMAGSVFTRVGHMFEQQVVADHGTAAIEDARVGTSGLTMPYAVPIATGCLIAFCMQIWRG